MCISILNSFSGLECIKGKVQYNRQVKMDTLQVTKCNLNTSLHDNCCIDYCRPCKNSLHFILNTGQIIESLLVLL